MDGIRAITFDAFGTIVDTGRAVLIGVAGRVVRDHLPSVTPERFLERWDHYFFRIDHNPFLTLSQATERSLREAFEEHGVRADPKPYVERLQQEWLHARAYPEVPGVLGALEGTPMAVVSNADDVMLKQILSRNGLAFDVVVSSEACRAYKPASEIFEVAVRELGVPPRDVSRKHGWRAARAMPAHRHSRTREKLLVSDDQIPATCPSVPMNASTGW